jgi:hypothetical protein
MALTYKQIPLFQAAESVIKTKKITSPSSPISFVDLYAYTNLVALTDILAQFTDFSDIFGYECSVNAMQHISRLQAKEYFAGAAKFKSGKPIILYNNIARVILFNGDVIGYFQIDTNAAFTFNARTFTKYLKFVIQLDTSFLTTFILEVRKFITLILRHDIKSYYIRINAGNQELITLLLNSGWMFAGKQAYYNHYIIDYRIAQKAIATKRTQEISLASGRIIGYEDVFIMSVKIKSPDINTGIFRNYLLSAELQEVNGNARRPLVLYLEALESLMFDRRYYNTKCYIMNVLSKSHKVITNKYWLYINYEKQFPKQCKKYMCATCELNQLDIANVLKRGRIYITRPVGPNAWSGHDIVVISDSASIAKARAFIPKYEHFIASEYITDPLLFEGKKTHCRCFLLASIINGTYSTWLFDFCRLYHAKLPYKNDDWENKEIHDTHLKSTSRNIFAPDDIPDPIMKSAFVKKAWPKIQDCMQYVSKILEKYCTPYDNAKNAFEIFGCDIMVQSDYNIKLIEINEHTGLDLKPEPLKIEEFSQKYFERINDMIINPHINGIPSKYPALYSSNQLLASIQAKFKADYQFS